MRLLHPKTLDICSRRNDIPKTVIAHAWSEVFKYCASGQRHPKMFIKNKRELGFYLAYVFSSGVIRGCNFDEKKILNLPKDVYRSFAYFHASTHYHAIEKYFDDNYLFSDACSLYFKGINIFPDIFGDQWRKYIPVESHKEIMRQVTKTLSK